MLPPNELAFAPEPMKLRAGLLYAVIGIGTVGPLYCWWKHTPVKSWLPALLIALAIAVGRELWMRFAPHRRETLSIEGHDAHEDALAHAIATRVANVVDMRAFDTVKDVIG